MNDLISRQAAIDALAKFVPYAICDESTESYTNGLTDAYNLICQLPSAQPDERMLHESCTDCPLYDKDRHSCPRFNKVIPVTLRELPSAQPEQRYTEEELRVFQHGISLSLLSKRSAQHWHYDEDTATEIKFLERLYEKVCADIRGEEGGGI